MDRGKCKGPIGLVALVAISLCACPMARAFAPLPAAAAQGERQIAFTPHVPTLSSYTTPEAPDLSLQATIAPPFGPGVPSSSREAMDLCLDEFTWGDEGMGYCRTAREGTYYVWTDPDHVFVVPEGAPFLDEFQDAVVARAAEYESFTRLAGDLGVEVGGLGASVIGILVGCSAGGPVGWFLCGVAFGGGLLDGVVTSQTADRLVTDLIDFFRESRRADYYLCRVHGGPDLLCQEEAGITAEELAPAQEDASHEGSTP